MNEPMNDADKKIGYWGVVAIGIGGMVGGGIFAVLGLAVQLAHGGTAIAFAIAGVVALLTTYSYAKLSVVFPSQGGTVTFLDRAFGPGLLAGSLNILLWLSYIIMLSLYAYAFGSYGAAFLPSTLQPVGKHLLITLVILSITGLNLLNARVISRAESWIVGIKIAVLMLFVGVGIWGIELKHLASSTWAEPVQLVAGGFIIFLAYEGFELIANAAQDTSDPHRTLPRAYYSAVLFVIVLYMLVAIVTVGNLPVAQIVEAKDYALAAAAKPFLGHVGFTLIAIAAMLSTASAINATLYGAARLSYVVAVDGELPSILENKVWNQPALGLLVTTTLTLLVANLFDLSSISIMGSSGFLLIFAAVNLANARLAQKTHSRKWFSFLGSLTCLLAFFALLWQTYVDSPLKILALIVILALSVGIEILYRRISRRNRVFVSSSRKS